MDNITRRTKSQKSTSMDDISIMNLDESSSLLDATIKSLPATGYLNTSGYCELKDKLSAVQKELESAHEEIGNLNNENLQLKLQITEMNKKLDLLVKLTTQQSSYSSTPKCKSNKTPANRNKRSLTKRNILSNELNLTQELVSQDKRSRSISNESPTQVAPKETSISYSEIEAYDKNVRRIQELQEKGNGNDLFIHKSHEIEISPCDRNPDPLPNEHESIGFMESQEINVTKKNIAHSSTFKKNKIQILGDQTCLGLSQKLSETRKNKWNDKYAVIGYSKPQASAIDILSSVDNIIKHSNSNDIIVLSLGSNDKDPYQFVFELCNALYRLQKFRVLVLSIANSEYINSDMQNRYVKLLCKHYKYAKFIDADEMDRDTLCFKLNIEIDSLDYDLQFINCVKHKNLKPIKPVKEYKKGTIPYLLNKLKNKSQMHRHETPSKELVYRDLKTKMVPKSSQKLKVGSIPYYYLFGKHLSKRKTNDELNKKQDILQQSKESLTQGQSEINESSANFPQHPMVARKT